MMATSHAICGAAIAIAVKEPILALPLAFASHFICDALPHIGLDEYGGHNKKPRLFHRILATDSILLTLFIGFLLFAGAPWLIFACVFLAGCPDFVWAYRYVFQEKLGKATEHPKNIFNHFHSSIQWSQTLRGAYLELPFTVTLLYIVTQNL